MLETEAEDEIFTREDANFKLRVKATEDGLVMRIDRRPGSGLPLYETMTLRYDEAEWMRILLMEAMG